MPNFRMPATLRGAFHVTAVKPVTQEEPCFMLELSVYMRYGSREPQKEHCRVRWYGAAARNWWREHSGHVREGTTLALVLRDPFSVVGRTSETQALIVHCELWTDPAPAFLRDEFSLRAQADAASFHFSKPSTIR